ncbi:MAG: LLM class flavin-dependent oxidoreductase [Anaerolineae bacterium]|nr:LLM class flavin-dependent oxidoreductase [Anaerolineae bacterium]
MTSVQLGMVMPAEWREKRQRATYVEDLNRALRLIAGHFDSAWMVDHLMFDDKDILEGFTALTYMAALHPQLKFGHAVLCQSFRNPALLAKMAATLQFMSGGRFILGVGAGWNEAEYRAYGYDFPTNRVRVEQLEETLQIIKALWTREKATFMGRYYNIEDAELEPKPDPLPTIMVGAFRPKMLHLTARYADWWNVSSTGIEPYRRMCAEFESACAEVGRAPSNVRRSWIGGCACASTQREAQALTEGRWSADDPEDFGFVGTPQQVVEQMRPFIDLGVDYFMFDPGGFPDLTTVELLLTDVLPALNR